MHNHLNRAANAARSEKPMPVRNASAVVALLFVAGVAFGGTIDGRVVGIADGDSITVLDDVNRKQHKIRILGIDAPERASQPFGNASKTALSALVFNRTVRVEWAKRDRYQRVIGKVAILDNPSCQGRGCSGVDAGLEQVKSGMAWWYRQYSKEQVSEDQTAYEQAEFNAKIRRLGLWSETKPVPPWEWRRER